MRKLDYTQHRYAERRKKLEAGVKAGPTIKLAERIVTDDPEVIHEFFTKCIERGLEGIIAKRLEAPYQAGTRRRVKPAA